MNKKLTCLIVDDEPPAAGILSEYINAIGSLELVGTCTNAVQALDILCRQNIDLLFLDIQMPQILGTDFVRALNQRPKVIFTTAYRKFAIEGFELNAVDYLLKPISFERFLMSVNRVLELPPVNSEPAPGKNEAAVTEKFIHLRVNRKTQKIPLEQIVYIESLRDYCRIVTVDRNYVTKQPISSFEGLLPRDSFIRIHRSFIVASQKITSYTNEMIEINRQELPIGRNYRHEVERFLRS